MRRRALTCIAVAFAAVLGGAVGPGRADAIDPAPGPAQIFGGPANGCIRGAEALPADGTGFEAIRLSRHRYFGHPATVAFVERLGRRAEAAGLAPFYVGDMARPRGGPMPNGHASHQTGLDVDIWLNLDPKPYLPPEAREEVPLPSMVLADQSAIDPARFGPAQKSLIRFAAQDKAIDRLFVHWTIKAALCAEARPEDADWLRRVRPWWGHMEHFHVRLACPADSPDCVRQPPLPPGDGCDSSLQWWFKPHPPSAGEAAPVPSTPHALPAQCRRVLASP